jgi:hypothetical protein
MNSIGTIDCICQDTYQAQIDDDNTSIVKNYEGKIYPFSFPYFIFEETVNEPRSIFDCICQVQSEIPLSSQNYFQN